MEDIKTEEAVLPETVEEALVGSDTTPAEVEEVVEPVVETPAVEEVKEEVTTE